MDDLATLVNLCHPAGTPWGGTLAPTLRTSSVRSPILSPTLNPAPLLPLLHSSHHYCLIDGLPTRTAPQRLPVSPSKVRHPSKARRVLSRSFLPE